jgi:hypothetical protein
MISDRARPTIGLAGCAVTLGGIAGFTDAVVGFAFQSQPIKSLCVGIMALTIAYSGRALQQIGQNRRPTDGNGVPLLYDSTSFSRQLSDTRLLATSGGLYFVAQAVALSCNLALRAQHQPASDTVAILGGYAGCLGAIFSAYACKSSWLR